MKPIRVTYRAVFRSPLGPLNPLGVNIPVAMTVEVYEARPQVWKAREKDTGKDRTLPIPSQPDALGAMLQIGKFFKEQCQDWQMWGSAWTDTTPPRILYPQDVVIDEAGKVRLIEPEDGTEVGETPKGKQIKNVS